jgi:hypothetical protein
MWVPATVSTAVMQQTAPFPISLAELVKQVTYRPGWGIRLENVDRDSDAEGKVVGYGLTLIITTLGRNSYRVNDGETYRVNHYFIVPAATYDVRAWTRWLFDRFIDVETHECMEFFKLGGKRPFAPSHGPGNNPYSVRERQTEDDAHTMFTGERTKGTV